MHGLGRNITEKDLRAALTTVLSHPNVVGIVRELPSGIIDNMQDDDAMVSSLVTGLLEQRENGISVIASSINQHMACHPTIKETKPNVINEIQRLCENDTNLVNLLHLFASKSARPVIAHMPTAQVGWCPTNGETAVGPYVCIPMWDTFIAQDGSVFVSYSYVFFEGGAEVMIVYTPRKLTRDTTLFPSLNETIFGCLSCDNEYHRLFVAMHKRLEERLSSKPSTV